MFDSVIDLIIAISVMVVVVVMCVFYTAAIPFFALFGILGLLIVVSVTDDTYNKKR